MIILKVEIKQGRKTIVTVSETEPTTSYETSVSECVIGILAILGDVKSPGYIKLQQMIQRVKPEQS